GARQARHTIHLDRRNACERIHQKGVGMKSVGRVHGESSRVISPADSARVEVEHLGALARRSRWIVDARAKSHRRIKRVVHTTAGDHLKRYIDLECWDAAESEALRIEQSSRSATAAFGGPKSR